MASPSVTPCAGFFCHTLPGAAITDNIKGVGHEFTTISGVLENVVEIGLNLKKVRFKFFAGGAASARSFGEGR